MTSLATRGRAGCLSMWIPFGAAILTACCLNLASAQLLSPTPSSSETMLPQKEPTVQSEAEKKAAYETYKLQARAYQAVYDNFRYTDAQREQTIDFIAAAMKVIRGEAEFDSLKLLLPVVRTGMALNLALALVVVLVEALPQGAESAEAAAAKFLPPAPPQQQDDGNPPG